MVKAVRFTAPVASVVKTNWVAAPCNKSTSLNPVIVEGEEIVAVRRLVPAVAVKVRLLKVATPAEETTLGVPERSAPDAVSATVCSDWVPVVTRLALAS